MERTTIVAETRACRICGNSTLVPILELGRQFLTGVFPRTLDQMVTCGPLDLVKCHAESDADHCGLVQLRHSYGSTEMYGEYYGYRSGLNRSMVTHLESVARRLGDFVRLEPSDIVLDIGSNDGTLLGFFTGRGAKRVGIDPTAKKFMSFYPPDVHIIPDFFSGARFRAEFKDRSVKIVTSVAMFYDLEAPIDFARQVRELLAADGVWHLEQSYVASMLAANAYDTICHEHLEYYGLRQIKYIMDRVGLKIVDVTTSDVNGGSFAVTVARLEAPYPEAHGKIRDMLGRETALGLHGLGRYRQFKDAVYQHREQLRELLLGLRAEGALVLGYGASTKGNVILQFCGITPGDLPFIAEVNEDKFGCYTPGTRIPIVSEAAARAMNPSYFLALPWHFRSNLLEREAAFIGAGGAMIFPLPRIEVVRR